MNLDLKSSCALHLLFCFAFSRSKSSTSPVQKLRKAAILGRLMLDCIPQTTYYRHQSSKSNRNEAVDSRLSNDLFKGTCQNHIFMYLCMICALQILHRSEMISLSWNTNHTIREFQGIRELTSYPKTEYFRSRYPVIISLILDDRHQTTAYHLYKQKLTWIHNIDETKIFFIIYSTIFLASDDINVITKVVVIINDIVQFFMRNKDNE